jgi:hypothetical protein
LGAGVPACPPLSIRIGVSAGEATRENGDLYGPPVVEAARLCAAAAPGQILVSEVVRLLARGKGHTFTAVGELTLKGLPEPVAACEVKWEPIAPAAGVPLPPRLAATPMLELFGRSTEQDVLAKAWSHAQEGRRRVVLLAGEPGIGKTRRAAVIGRQFDLALLTRVADASALFPGALEPLPESRKKERAEGSPSPEERASWSRRALTPLFSEDVILDALDEATAAALITAALAETEQLDLPAEATKLEGLRERLS